MVHVGSLILVILAPTIALSLYEAVLVKLFRASHAKRRIKAVYNVKFARCRIWLVQVIEDELMPERVPFFRRHQVLIFGTSHHFYQDFGRLEPLTLS